MQAQAQHMKMLHVETTDGTELVPSDLVHATPTPRALADYVNGEVEVHDSGDPDVERQEGWYSRFSAPGFMDRTDWDGPHDTEEKALDALAELHEVCRKCWEACWDSTDGDCADKKGSSGS